jgi:hypothetical protein
MGEKKEALETATSLPNSHMGMHIDVATFSKTGRWQRAGQVCQPQCMPKEGEEMQTFSLPWVEMEA